MSRHELDARGLLCPMPVIRVQNAIHDLGPGDILVAYCSDPGALNDVPSWCRVNGHTVLEAQEDAGEVRITIEVGDD